MRSLLFTAVACVFALTACSSSRNLSEDAVARRIHEISTVIHSPRDVVVPTPTPLYQCIYRYFFQNAKWPTAADELMSNGADIADYNDVSFVEQKNGALMVRYRATVGVVSTILPKPVSPNQQDKNALIQSARERVVTEATLDDESSNAVRTEEPSVIFYWGSTPNSAYYDVNWRVPSGKVVNVHGEGIHDVKKATVKVLHVHD